ncbi:MAG TPA: lytic transglycosylase domain-containing protein [Ramlibacter sp.]|jgi:hypothetical protein|uniref:lytic transglycosylase domain-containing protein n=1 Tax=Ramlibacter sp. TaxID=1917967 RepID=UPI002D58A01E|nr:lytic transglycosylase domain-containing protein [Ramlibacter sp.]HZY20677.1 lytic transglycosylase domain-containing protein [Ramlibacter sp.]
MTARRRCLAPLLAAALVLGAGAGRAEIWGYVDGKGVAHFATERVDERYELFWRGGEAFDTAAGLPERATTPRAVAVPSTSAARLVAYFEISPGYRQVKHHLREASRAHGIELELLQALIATESGFDAAAVSPKGAVGLMQVMPATAQRYGVQGDQRAPIERKLADPGTNIRAGSRYLRYLLDLFPGRLDLALAAYNAGEGAVQRAGNRIPNYRETQNYVRTVLQLYSMLRPPALGAAPGVRVPGRVRIELAGRAEPGPDTAALSGAMGGPAAAAPPSPGTVPAGGALHRGNMPALLPEAGTESPPRDPCCH